MNNELEHGGRKIANQPVELTLVRIGGPEIVKSDSSPKASLSKEWDTQAGNLARRFAEKLGLPVEDYIKTLPKFTRKPINFKSEHDVPETPIIVETRIPLAEMLNTVRIDPFFDLQEIEDWTEGGFAKPSGPYATWLTYLPNKSVQEVRANLGKNQRGGTAFDGIALFLKHPQILNRYYLKFPGSQVGHDDVPFLFAWSNSVENSTPTPLLSYGSVEGTSPKFACVVASRI